MLLLSEFMKMSDPAKAVCQGGSKLFVNSGTQVIIRLITPLLPIDSAPIYPMCRI
jgi:hypothetical protein